MPQPIIIDSHMHIHRTRDEGILEKESLEVWEYGSKTDVRFSTYDGVLEDVLRALNDASADRGVLLNFFDFSYVLSRAIASIPEDVAHIPTNSATDSDGIRPPLSRPRIIGDEIVP